MSKFEPIGGVGITATPLINFDVIVDEDISLLLYILKEVRNYEVFDLDKIDNYKSLADIVSEVYHARYDNPLYFLMKDEKDKDFLDQCYKEFMEDPYFLKDYSISTDFYPLIDKFIKAGEILSTIVYKNTYEKDLIEKDPVLSKVSYISIERVNMDKYTQVYLNRISDVVYFKENIIKHTYYFSSRGSNLIEDKTEVIDTDLLKDLLEVSIFDMYRKDRIGRSIY